MTMYPEYSKKYCFVYCGDDYCNCNLKSKLETRDVPIPMPSTSAGLYGDPSLPTNTQPNNEEKVWAPPAEDDFGFSTVSEKIQFDPSNILSRSMRIRDLMFNFLDKLARDPEKDIHWPNRDVKIAEFKARIDRILDGSEE